MTNKIVHFDIAGPELGPLTDFYSELFGWNVSAGGEGYAPIDTGELRGGLAESETTGVNLGVEVEDLAAALRQATELGGEIVMPATDNGWVFKALVRDPAGNLVSLIQADQKPNS